MYLKPRNTQLNTRGIVFKRYTDTLKSATTLNDYMNDNDIVISKYDTNNYVKYKTFDYSITSKIDIAEVQYLRGLMAEEITFDIRYTNDDLGLLHNDDLVVIDNRLYQVINPQKIMRRLPKPYYIYTCTLKSIL
jgi:hypothetical protein